MLKEATDHGGPVLQVADAAAHVREQLGDGARQRIGQTSLEHGVRLLLRIQLGGVGGQAFEVEPLRRTRREEVFDRLTAMNRRTIQMTSSLPRTCRRSWRRKATIAGPRNASCWTWVNSLPSGVTALMADRWSRVSGARKTGVCPRGASVRATNGSR